MGEHLRALGHRNVGVIVDSRLDAGGATTVDPSDKDELYVDSRQRLVGCATPSARRPTSPR